jgi:hypothetical protein
MRDLNRNTNFDLLNISGETIMGYFEQNSVVKPSNRKAVREKCLRALSRIAARLRSRLPVDEQLVQDASQSLSAVPLTEIERRSAWNEFRNGMKYAADKSYGAGSFELRMLIRRIVHLVAVDERESAARNGGDPGLYLTES